jgi:hypothetical protein
VTTEATKFYAQAFFVHGRMLSKTLNAEDADAFLRSGEGRGPLGLTDGIPTALSERIVTDIYQTRPPELAIWLMEDRRVGDTAVVTTTQSFYFRKGDNDRRAFRAEFAANPAVELEGTFSEDKCVGATGRDLLSRRKRVTVLGSATVVSADPLVKIELTPWFMGQLVERLATEPAPKLSFESRHEVWPAELDQFEKLKDAPKVTQKMLTQVGKIPEADIKAYFADILGEPFIPKDWGGENFDLSTSRATMEGRPVNVAFAFKGPGKSGELNIAGMGKNGDQGLRLFNDATDIGVVQHHTKIAASVRSLMEAVARNRNAKFMIIDGATTAQILSVYGYLDK